jgi:hypothetical protein
MVLLVAAVLSYSVWVQCGPVPAADEEAPVPSAFFARSLITGRIECDRSWRCSATDGLDNNNFWYIDMRAIPHEQVAHISEDCGYDMSGGCPAQYLIYPDFPFLKVLQVTLVTVPKPSPHFSY